MNIICINNVISDPSGRYHLTIGKKYLVYDKKFIGGSLQYLVKNDVGYKFFHEAFLFKDLQRKAKLEKINLISQS